MQASLFRPSSDSYGASAEIIHRVIGVIAWLFCIEGGGTYSRNIVVNFNKFDLLLNCELKLLDSTTSKPSPNQFDLELIAGSRWFYDFSAA